MPSADALRAAVARRRDELWELAAELVRRPSLLGSEEPAQALVDEHLRGSGLAVERVQPDAEAALADPTAGYPYLSYEGRSSVVGRLAGSGGGRSLHLNGHVDVVPIDGPETWRFEPFSATVADGRLYGRGAGDMKGGLAAVLIAAAAVAEVCDERRGDLVVSSVIEEECGGNGMWSVLRAGHGGDATLIAEPTGLTLGRAGTGVVWARLEGRGVSGHSMGGKRTGPFDDVSRAVAAMRELEAERNRQPLGDPLFGEVSDWPYGITIGKVEGGVWPASMPSSLVAHVRVGFGRDWTPAAVQEQIRTAVGAAAPEVEVGFEAFRAHAHCHDMDSAWPRLVAAAHGTVVGGEPETSIVTATSDSRYPERECLCYGPLAGNLHGTDEWVDLDSLVTVAEVIAVAAAEWLAAGSNHD